MNPPVTRAPIHAAWLSGLGSATAALGASLTTMHLKLGATSVGSEFPSELALGKSVKASSQLAAFDVVMIRLVEGWDS